MNLLQSLHKLGQEPERYDLTALPEFALDNFPLRRKNEHQERWITKLSLKP